MIGQRLILFYCSFTCIYFPCILFLLNYNNTLYNVGKYKFIPILLILMFAEVIKYLFSILYNQRHHFDKIDSKALLNSKPRKSWSKTFKDILRFFIILISLCIIYYGAIVLFGAPLSTHHEETTMLTIVLSTLTFIPPCLHLGVETALAVLTGAQSANGNIIVEAMGRNINYTLLGTWLGAIVIPLDWDRPWQIWPIPCGIGALVGYMVAHYVTLIKTLYIVKPWRTSKKVHRQL
ncbi:phosphatidylinositol-glycan biosynthesis class F protein [Chelonus insularis]|uniref:phosphatidylinositol-glycan biosynthesis class F protein n=1 Tax=Chelonus insularis TaxID=460826 RepID=UPI00158D78CB|nr:phosphatidylinositol-glycan biosynthesis class F protein [Chelonus insularis]